VRSDIFVRRDIRVGEAEPEVVAPYGSDGRRWFTRYREPELIAVLAATGFGIRNIRRHRAYRDWLSVHAIRDPAGASARGSSTPLK
jgi:hypothetical protein